MDKKKAIVCTVLFSVVVFGIFIYTFLIKSEEYGCSLFDVIAPWICMVWNSEKIRKFYRWLINQ